jgi:hypothetical protein
MPKKKALETLFLGFVSTRNASESNSNLVELGALFATASVASKSDLVLAKLIRLRACLYLEDFSGDLRALLTLLQLLRIQELPSD